MRSAPVKRRLLPLALVLLLAAGGYLYWLLGGPSGPACPSTADSADYPWPRTARSYRSLASRFPPPRGAECVPLTAGSWGDWLRGLPMLPPGAPVRFAEGQPLPALRLPWVAGVADLDVRRHQECADTIFRLRLEFLRQAGRERELVVPTGGGDPLSWARWQQGFRLRLVGDRLRLVRDAAPDASRASFDRYLASVFLWCGTYSLEEMSRPVPPAQLAVGDILVRPGSPGHAVLIADLARTPNGRLHALILQGHMPAQSAQISRASLRGAWYPLDFARPLDLPDARPLPWSRLRRFR